MTETARPSRSPYWALIPPVLALAASVARWLLQGSNNLYTTPSKRFYLPDPDLGWRIAPETPAWLGLDAIAALAGFTAALGAVAWFVRQREQPQNQTWTPGRRGLWALSIVTLAVPIWAFTGGTRPEGAREELPAGVIGPAPGGFEGSLDGVPAGTYEVVSDSQSSITARIKAGGEEFDARFTGNLAGTVVFDPRDLEAPVSARVRVDTASVDTGVKMRSEHAASEDYLGAAKHPEIALELVRLTSTRQGASASEIVFWADGALTLMGKRMEVPVQGTVKALDEAGRQRIGSTRPAIVVTAELTLVLADSPLSPQDFNRDRIPVRAVLIMAQASSVR
ncbi:MAG TPA: YceI family protein [Haliangium sp.]|nr:YceI family protein [Haliangium sp.]